VQPTKRRVGCSAASCQPVLQPTRGPGLRPVRRLKRRGHRPRRARCARRSAAALAPLLNPTEQFPGWDASARGGPGLPAVARRRRSSTRSGRPAAAGARASWPGPLVARPHSESTLQPPWSREMKTKHVARPRGGGAPLKQRANGDKLILWLLQLLLVSVYRIHSLTVGRVVASSLLCGRRAFSLLTWTQRTVFHVVGALWRPFGPPDSRLQRFARSWGLAAVRRVDVLLGERGGLATPPRAAGGSGRPPRARKPSGHATRPLGLRGGAGRASSGPVPPSPDPRAAFWQRGQPSGGGVPWLE
jgi:hypothetical protein